MTTHHWHTTIDGRHALTVQLSDGRTVRGPVFTTRNNVDVPRVVARIERLYRVRDAARGQEAA